MSSSLSLSATLLPGRPGRLSLPAAGAYLRAGIGTVALALALALSPAAPAAGIQFDGGPAASGSNYCAPPALGAPCAMGGIATLGAAEPLPSLELGNPIHLASGNKYQLDIDLPPNRHTPGLELVRHYNSLSTQGGVLGPNWSLSYDTRLLNLNGGWQLGQADGSTRRIAPPASEGNDRLWRWPDGRQLRFDSTGRLIQIKAGATTVRIHRHPAEHALAGLIRRVESSHGQALVFHYGQHAGQAVLAAVDTPLGQFRYRYGTPAHENHRMARLESVERPDGMQRLYLYEGQWQAGNPYALTGIALRMQGEAAHRLTTWHYDRHGRVIALHHHGRALPSLQVQYLQVADGRRPGLTRILSSNGRQQDIHFEPIGGEYRLLSRAWASEPNSIISTSYDRAGRLAAIGGTVLQRRPGGELAGLLPETPGWPGLALHRPEQGRYSWYSHSTGITTQLANIRGQPVMLQYANGDTLQLHHDAQGRPARIEAVSASPAASTVTRLLWRGRHLIRIEHPAETELRHYDAHGRMVERIVKRSAGPDFPTAYFRDAFRYDSLGRLLQHHLPEGGVLHYEWRGNTRQGATLAKLRWEDAQGRVRAVISGRSPAPGYRYGNGLVLESGAATSTHADTLALVHNGQPWWLQRRAYDTEGRVAHDYHEFPLFNHHDSQRYWYDRHSRLQGALHHAPGRQQRWWYAWNADGSLAALNRAGHSRVPVWRRDAAGLPVTVGRYALLYGPARRLQAVKLAATGQALLRFQHNAFGHRIIKQAAEGSTHYLYVGNQLVAEARRRGVSKPSITRRFLYAGRTPVGMIEYLEDGPAQLYAVHADLLGAPRMVTDSTRRLRWLASYSPTGKATRIAGDLHFPLRLPGQYEDIETGWHDNLLRSYDPELGHYLEPDPLGPLPGTDTYGYAGHQPWRYTDPYGLVLFAFDGTRYSPDSMGNVWQLAQAYNDGAAHYHSGPGNSQFLDWDAVTAWRAGRILENQWQALLNAIEHQPRGTVLPIDIIGFSRGAALARHFGNRIAAHVRDGMFSVSDPLRGPVSACVDLRYMGLFDTVAQFGIAGSHNHLYDFGIAELWTWVAHAVAMHEHRWAFPLTSADAGNTYNLIEVPFVGAHADIGGGLALLGPPNNAARNGMAATGPASLDAAESDLAKVALGWMHWQALAATVNFNALPEADLHIESPVLRDPRSPLSRSLLRGDRAVLAPSGVRRHAQQANDAWLGHASRAEAEAFINRVEGWRSQSTEAVGTVDMQGYSRWLKDTLGWSPQ